MFYFNVEIDKSGNFVVRDISNMFDRFPTKITSFKMSVLSADIPNGMVTDLDILNYLKLRRKNNELYTITPETLSINGKLPDSVYTLEFRINNLEKKVLKFVYLDELNTKMLEILDKVDSDIDIESNYLFEDKEQMSSDLLKYLYITAVYFKLLFSIQEPINEAATNDLIDKLRRLLNLA